MAKSGKTENSMIGYDYDLEKGDFDGDYKFTLTKRIDFSNDNTIKLTIEFPTVIDDGGDKYTKNANGDLLYNAENRKKALEFIKDRAHQFIEKLITHNSTKKGGQKRKQRKTKKNRKINNLS
jgi:hypothetical protein